MIKLSEIMDSIWMKEYDYSIIFYYVAFEIGIFRIYPGVSLYKRFDPVSRPW